MYQIYTSYFFLSYSLLSYTVERMWYGGTSWGNSAMIENYRSLIHFSILCQLLLWEGWRGPQP